MQTDTPIAEAIGDYSEAFAGAAAIETFSIDARGTFERLLRHLTPAHTAETGCGKATILFSLLSAEHTIFTVDDRGEGEKSRLNLALNYPSIRRETMRAVFGPTQKTLPRHQFDAKLDAVLLGGPRGFPFPELEYYFFYPHLREGGLLFISDLHIPSVGRFWEVVKEDAMFDIRCVVDNLGVLRRTSAPIFDPYGDNWQEQRYNQRRIAPAQH
jgi:hypothetical protein